MNPIRFDLWDGAGGMKEHIIQQTGCNPYSGAGINYRSSKKTTILRSVDNTEYYDDNLNDINNPRYTLFGLEGDQCKNEKRFNEPFLNPNKTEHIYLYRVKYLTKYKKSYEWYGKYEIATISDKIHPDVKGFLRKIIIVSLRKIDE